MSLTIWTHGREAAPRFVFAASLIAERRTASRWHSEDLKVPFGKCEIHLHGQPLDGTSGDSPDFRMPARYGAITLFQPITHHAGIGSFRKALGVAEGEGLAPGKALDVAEGERLALGTALFL